MTSKEFDALVRASGLKAPSVAGCKLVLVDGVGVREAARKTGISHSNIIRMLRKIPREICPTCKQPRKDLLEV